MKGILKLFVDIGLLAIFFIFYTRGEEGTKLQSAILPLMIATIVAILISYIGGDFIEHMVNGQHYSSSFS